ncbi:MAG: hypothetical protein P8J87_19135, partial [Verrucomicrobiales bacterium]|nr:hypothetical protein [Verrucomicrobiales bacterium]
MPTPRSRVLVTITLFVVIGLGLASRKFPLPTFLAENSGDALWTGAVYLSIAFLLPRTAPLKLG